MFVYKQFDVFMCRFGTLFLSFYVAIVAANIYFLKHKF